MNCWITQTDDGYYRNDTSEWVIVSGKVEPFTCNADQLCKLDWDLYGLYPTGSIRAQKTPFTFDLPFLSVTVDAKTATELHGMISEVLYTDSK
ncbi:MAG: hypothetical protein CMP20_09230 [Rickettsiales bacterium]|nr:hypothetical protein [Rickettsiales bacterium]